MFLINQFFYPYLEPKLKNALKKKRQKARGAIGPADDTNSCQYSYVNSGCQKLYKTSLHLNIKYSIKTTTSSNMFLINFICYPYPEPKSKAALKNAKKREAKKRAQSGQQTTQASIPTPVPVAAASASATGSNPDTDKEIRKLQKVSLYCEDAQLSFGVSILVFIFISKTML